MRIIKMITIALLSMFAISLYGINSSESREKFSFPDYGNEDSRATARPKLKNRVHAVGKLWMNITNCGYFGNPQDEFKDPCTGATAASGELPGGSGKSFIFLNSLMFGGYLDSAKCDVQGEEAIAFQGPLVSTCREGWDSNPTSKEAWAIKFHDDPDGASKSEIKEFSNVKGKENCFFDDVYDPAAKAEEQFVTYYTDKYVKRTYTGEDKYDDRPHIPLGIEIKQTTYAWSYDFASKFIIMDYTLYNYNEERKDIYDFFMGLYFDCDIGDMNASSNGKSIVQDDIGGYIEEWRYKDSETGEEVIHPLNLAWFADNDGRDYKGSDSNLDSEPGAGNPLDGNTSVVTVRVLRNPNPKLTYAYNIYIADESEEKDWSPQWGVRADGANSGTSTDDKGVVHTSPHTNPNSEFFWKYDLTPTQEGYCDSMYVDPGGEKRAGGRTEGNPLGDPGRYMVMSNDEFDYNVYMLNHVDFGDYEAYYNINVNPDSKASKQAKFWRDWITPTEASQNNSAIVNGVLKDRNDVSNGEDVKAILSFGPLGTFVDGVSVATGKYIKSSPSSNKLDSLDVTGVVTTKGHYAFKYGDSLKLTIAFIANENFHRSLSADPNYKTDNAFNPNGNGGIDEKEFDRGWQDALFNATWAERLYDAPMLDTKIWDPNKKIYRSDGWYGEDVGSDGIFAGGAGQKCWWMSGDDADKPVYTFPDEGEGDGKITKFKNSITDENGQVAENEDELLKYGRQKEVTDETVGATLSQTEGSLFGYAVKYQGEWVRYGYMDGLCNAGDGVPDFTGPPPPPAPKVNVEYQGNDIKLIWYSIEKIINKDGSEALAGPELTIDVFSRVNDFEGYKIMAALENKSRDSYVTLAEIDHVNFTYQEYGKVGKYRNMPMSQDSLDILKGLSADSLQKLNLPEGFGQDAFFDGVYYEKVPFGKNRGLRKNFESGRYKFIAEKGSIQYSYNNEYGTDTTVSKDRWKYTFTIKDAKKLKKEYFAVSAIDFGDPAKDIPSGGSNPMVNAVAVVPAQNLSNKDKVYVTPNPYRGDKKDEPESWYGNTDGSMDMATKRKDGQIVFWNLPPQAIIRIYTAAGDLVKSISHNGYSRDGSLYNFGKNAAWWNLINSNNQSIASGVYLFSVEGIGKNSGFEYVGKFVIIK